MAGVRRGEEQNGIGDLLRAGDFTQRDAELKLLAEAADPLLLCIVADPQVRCISVSVEPGDTRLQRTPLPASSRPTVSARLFSAAFEAP